LTQETESVRSRLGDQPGGVTCKATGKPAAAPKGSRKANRRSKLKEDRKVDRRATEGEPQGTPRDGRGRRKAFRVGAEECARVDGS